MLRHSGAEWLRTPFNKIEAKDARALLEGFVREGHGPKARLTLSWLRTLWRWAYRREIADSNVMDKVEVHYQVSQRERWYSDEEVQLIWHSADHLDPIAATYVKALILLAPRKTALANARVRDLDNQVMPTLWTTPHEFTKSKKTATKKRVYLTPLPALAASLVRPLLEGKAGSDFIFAAQGRDHSLDAGSRLKRKLVKHGAPPDFSFHAVRHTVATWLETKGRDDFDRGLVLNHAGSGVTAGYSHGYGLDRKRDLMELWSNHVEALVNPPGK